MDKRSPKLTVRGVVAPTAEIFAAASSRVWKLPRQKWMERSKFWLTTKSLYLEERIVRRLVVLKCDPQHEEAI